MFEINGKKSGFYYAKFESYPYMLNDFMIPNIKQGILN